jgi:hypothetical protein
MSTIPNPTLRRPVRAFTRRFGRVTAVEAIRLTPKQLRNLFTRKPQLGEEFWKSYQRRRELLLKSNFAV